MSSGPLLYPPPGFHFRVVFELRGLSAQDVRFQEVNGLSTEMQYETVREGGENRFAHQLPVRAQAADLVLKRAILPDSGVYRWARAAFEDFQFEPINLLVSLLNDQHQPLLSWQVVHALPKKWDVGAFNAEQSAVALETLTLSYRYARVLKS